MANTSGKSYSKSNDTQLIPSSSHVIGLVLVAPVISLAIGLFQDFDTTRPEGEPPVNWVESIAIIAVILVVVAVRSLNDWQMETQFKALNATKEDRLVKVVRDGEERLIRLHQVVVGDVMLLEPGDTIPCDGVFLSGHNILCDESSETGEPDTIKKLSYQECTTLRDRHLMEWDAGGFSRYVDCFIVSGSKVLDGVGSYVVTSVGTKSLNGRIMMGSSITLP